jgi:hypothetical protein
LLGNDSVNKFPSVTNKQAIIDVFLCYNDGNSVFCWIAPRLYNEDPRPAEIELMESLETAVEDD